MTRRGAIVIAPLTTNRKDQKRGGAKYAGTKSTILNRNYIAIRSASGRLQNENLINTTSSLVSALRRFSPERDRSRGLRQPRSIIGFAADDQAASPNET
jgi:hypothetical protein